MTMTRNTKNEHTARLAENPSNLIAAREEIKAEAEGRAARLFTVTEFSSPRRRAAAAAERGHLFMTRAEYIELRMPARRAKAGHAIDDLIAHRGYLHRAQRVLGGRRLVVRDTFRAPGGYEVERATRRVA